MWHLFASEQSGANLFSLCIEASGGRSPSNVYVFGFIILFHIVRGGVAVL